MIDNDKVKELLLKIAEANIKAITLGAVTEEGDLHTAFLGPLEVQSLLLTIANTTIQQNTLGALTQSAKSEG